MYFPYLRGKQFELLALKERASLLGTVDAIIPVIEPIREPDGGLVRCLDALAAHEVQSVLVLNPTVGALASNSIADEISTFVGRTASTYQWNLGLIVDERTNVPRLLDAYTSQIACEHSLTLIHRGVTAAGSLLAEATRDTRTNDLVTEGLKQRHFRPFLITSRGVSLSDGFEAAEKNAAYLERPESFFSDDCLYYREEGWKGFGDYLTIGHRWAEGGFMPRAVAIHWTYQLAEDAPVMIRSFTSESNADTTNVAGKFLEAAGKLVHFLDTRGLDGAAANAIRDYHAASTYPGLGVLKKLSIQNHLELMVDIVGRQ